MRFLKKNEIKIIKTSIKYQTSRGVVAWFVSVSTSSFSRSLLVGELWFESDLRHRVDSLSLNKNEMRPTYRTYRHAEVRKLPSEAQLEICNM